MSYVRRLLSENSLSDGTIIRSYEVEVPRFKDWNPGLMVMELQIDREAAKYYSNTPWVLANQIWSAYCSADLGWDDLYETFMPYHRRDPIAWIKRGGNHLIIEVGLE